MSTPDPLEREVELFTQRHHDNLDGFWSVLGVEYDDPAHGVWMFRGDTGERRGPRSCESFQCRFPEPHVVELEWEDGQIDRFAYEFRVVHHDVRRLVLVTRDREVFAFEPGPVAFVQAG
jgi:hypothetical protein